MSVELGDKGRGRARLRRCGEAAAALVGFWCCAATSNEEPPPPPEPVPVPEEPDPWDEPPETSEVISAAVFVHNGTGSDVEVQFRPLAESVDLDCEALAEQPGRWLQDELFGEVVAWTVPVDTNVALPSGGHPRGCNAVRIEVAGAAPKIAWWFEGAPSVRSVRARGFDGLEAGGIDLRSLDGGLVLDDGNQTLLHDPSGPPAKTSGLCEASAATDRLAWADPVPQGQFTLRSISQGIDGCLGLELQADEGSPSAIWYLCVPVEVFPFEVDEIVAIEEQYASGSGEPGLAIVAAQSGRSLVVNGGAPASPITGFEQIELVRLSDCGLAVAPACGTVVSRGAAQVTWDDGTQVLLDTVETVSAEHLGLDEHLRRIAVTVAEERLALDAECAEGPDILGVDMQLVAADFGPQMGG